MLSCEFSEIFKNSLFYRTPPVAASVFCCDRRKFNLTGGFFIFLFMVTGRGIFIYSADPLVQ